MRRDKINVINLKDNDEDGITLGQLRKNFQAKKSVSMAATGSSSIAVTQREKSKKYTKRKRTTKRKGGKGEGAKLNNEVTLT